MAVTPAANAIDGIFLPSLTRFRVMAPHGATLLSFIQLSSRHIYLTGSSRGDLNVTWSAPLPTVNGAWARTGKSGTADRR